jgi:hypothetical protein
MHHNIYSYFRDPSSITDFQDIHATSNIHTDVMIDTEKGIPIVIAYANKSIACGS